MFSVNHMSARCRVLPLCSVLRQSHECMLQFCPNIVIMVFLFITWRTFIMLTYQTCQYLIQLAVSCSRSITHSLCHICHITHRQKMIQSESLSHYAQTEDDPEWEPLSHRSHYAQTEDDPEWEPLSHLSHYTQTEEDQESHLSQLSADWIAHSISKVT